jgi:quinoprotein glucose dehydrogenase
LTKATGGQGAMIYQQNCAGCHGLDRKGSPPSFPRWKGLPTGIWKRNWPGSS